MEVQGLRCWTTSMAVMTDVGDSITIDLRDADQSTDRRLRTGDRC